MGILNNYAEYRKNKPQYKEWEDKRNLEEAKRLDYLSKNGVDEKQKTQDIKRAKTVLNAIDVMDEYSQSKAEEMEVVTQQASTPVIQLGTVLGGVLSGISIFASKNIQKAFKEFMESFKKGNSIKLSPILAIPALLFAIPMLGSVIGVSIFSAKQETNASRLARAEAMNTRLNSAKQFAILDDEQEKQVEEIAKTIPMTEKEAEKFNKATRGFGIFGALKTIIKGNKDSEAKIKELKQKEKDDKLNIKNDIPLSEEQILEAKKDRQLIQNIVQKIDIASQEYAENTELVTGAIQAAALAQGTLAGFIAKAITNKIPKLQGKSNIIGIITGAILAIAGSIWAAGVQKQASRVARYKVKQDFLSNPEKLIYVDEDKTKDSTNVKVQPKEKKGFFKFLVEVIKNNKEYNEYKKQNLVKQTQLSQARERIEITPEQEKRAKQLQNNVFKMFNKVDEKSQTFSESTEALGEIVQNIIPLAAMVPGMTGLMKNMNKLAEGSAKNTKNIIGMIVSFAATLAPAIIINAIVTKEQKSASKVADMLAINELDDYRNFADYSNSENKKVSIQSTKEKAQTMSPLMAQFLNNEDAQK